MIRKIKNIVRWLPIIWRDRQWDWLFLIRILNRKLKAMEVSGYYDGNTEKRMRVARILTDRLIRNNYVENALFWHDKRWGEAKFETVDCEWVITYPNVRNRRDKEMQSREITRCYKHSDYMRQQDIDMLFGIMGKYIQGWWD